MNIIDAKAFYNRWDRKRSPNLDPLLAEPSFGLFRLEEKEGGFKKIPYSFTEYRVSPRQKPSNYIADIEIALRWIKKGDGLGFHFTPRHNICGIDIDWYKPQGGDVLRAIFERLGDWPTLTTRTLSGGLHLFGYLDPSGDVARRLGPSRQGILGCVEIYSTRGFFAEAFDVVRDVPLADLSAAITYLLDCHEALGLTLSPNLDTVPPVDRDDIHFASDEALIVAACARNRRVRDWLNTPHKQGYPWAWSFRLMQIAGDLRKTGASWDHVASVILRSPFVNQSYDNGVMEPRIEKAARLLDPARSPGWRKKIDANNAGWISKNQAMTEEGRKIMAAWSNQK